MPKFKTEFEEATTFKTNDANCLYGCKKGAVFVDKTDFAEIIADYVDDSTNFLKLLKQFANSYDDLTGFGIIDCPDCSL